MFTPPPKFNSLVIKTDNFENMEWFYVNLGMAFNKSYQNNGLKRYSYIYSPFVFELVEVNSNTEKTKNLEFQLIIDDINGYLEIINEFELQIIKNIWKDEKGSHFTFMDPENNIVTLSEKK